MDLFFLCLIIYEEISLVVQVLEGCYFFLYKNNGGGKYTHGYLFLSDIVFIVLIWCIFLQTTDEKVAM